MHDIALHLKVSWFILVSLCMSRCPRHFCSALARSQEDTLPFSTRAFTVGWLSVAPSRSKLKGLAGSTDRTFSRQNFLLQGPNKTYLTEPAVKLLEARKKGASQGQA